MKEEYLLRYIERGSSEEFVNKVEKNWNDWQVDLEAQENCKKVALSGGQYLSDVLYYIQDGDEEWMMQ